MTIRNDTGTPILARLRWAGIKIAEDQVEPGAIGYLPCEYVWYDLRAFTLHGRELAEYPKTAYGSSTFVFFQAKGQHHHFRKVRFLEDQVAPVLDQGKLALREVVADSGQVLGRVVAEGGQALEKVVDTGGKTALRVIVWTGVMLVLSGGTLIGLWRFLD
jgi:hypothetical protein